MTLVEAVRTRLTAAALILLHIAVSVLVVTSVIEACRTALAIVSHTENPHSIILVGALVTAFIPLGCILFWGYKALAVQVNYLFRNRQRYLMNHREGSAQGLMQQRRYKG
jgi:hypothetical protein